MKLIEIDKKAKKIKSAVWNLNTIILKKNMD